MEAKQAERVSPWRVIADVTVASGGYVALALVLLPSVCCLLGLPFFGALAGRAYLRVMGVRRGGVSTWMLGVLGTPVFLAPILALALAGSLLGVMDPDGDGSEPSRAAVTFAVSALMGMILFPLYGAPLEAVESSEGPLGAILASGARAARMGLRTSLGTGAVIGVVGVLPWVVVPLGHQLLTDEDPTFQILFALYLAMIPAHVVSLGLIAHARSEGRERFGNARTRAPLAAEIAPIHERLARSLLLAMSPLLILVPAVVLAVAMPTPAWREARQSTPGGVPYAEAFATSAHGLSIENPEPGLFVIASRDGGGAGAVRVSRAHDLGATVVRERFRGRDVWTLQARRSERVVMVSFDDRGVRVDDTPSDRIHARLGTIGICLLAAHLLAVGLLVMLTLRRTGVAANLDRPWMGGYRETAALRGVQEKEAYVQRVTRENVLASLPLAAIAIGLSVMIVVNL